MKPLIYYDTKTREVVFSTYRKLEAIFCDGVENIEECKKNFKSYITKGFLIEVLFDEEINSQVTRYYIKNMNKLLKSNKSYIDYNIVKIINNFLRKVKLENLDEF